MLVVDDDPVQLRLMDAILSRAGFEVHTAGDGDAALAQLAQSHPDAIVLDSVLPGMSGLELLRSMRLVPGVEMTPILVASGISDVSAKLDYFAEGANDYLVKPVEAAELVARVEMQLRMGSAWTNRFAQLMDARRALRQRLQDVPVGPDPFDTARALLRALPAEMHCAALVTASSAGYTRLAGQVAAVGMLIDRFGAEPVLAELPELHCSEPEAFAAEGYCPMCGSTGPERRSIVVPIGAMADCAGFLVFGCSTMSAEALSGLAVDAAEACGAVLCDQLIDWNNTLADREWVTRLIAERRFEIKLQPIVDLDSGEVVACEALSRFPDAVGPEEAFAIAARFGRNVALEMLIVEEVVRIAAALPPAISTHVNVSPMAALAPELLDILAACTRPMVVEVTEHDLMDIALFIGLRDALPPGILMAVDDVGAGYAGLTLLLRLRPDEIKIDRVVVAGVDADPARQALVAGLVRFADATGAGLVAEGIERAADLACLRELGVTKGQGYLFCRAVAPADLVEFAARHRRPVAG